MESLLEKNWDLAFERILDKEFKPYIYYCLAQIFYFKLALSGEDDGLSWWMIIFCLFLILLTFKQYHTECG